MAWYDHDIDELDNSMIFEDAWSSDMDSNYDSDPADDDYDDSNSGFKGSDDSSGFNESVMDQIWIYESADDQIDSNWCDDEVEPSTIPQYNSEVDQYESDPSNWRYSNKQEDGTENVEIESFTDWDDLF